MRSKNPPIFFINRLKNIFIFVKFLRSNQSKVTEKSKLCKLFISVLNMFYLMKEKRIYSKEANINPCKTTRIRAKSWRYWLPFDVYGAFFAQTIINFSKRWKIKNKNYENFLLKPSLDMPYKVQNWEILEKNPRRLKTTITHQKHEIYCGLIVANWSNWQSSYLYYFSKNSHYWNIKLV